MIGLTIGFILLDMGYLTIAVTMRIFQVSVVVRIGYMCSCHLIL